MCVIQHIGDSGLSVEVGAYLLRKLTLACSYKLNDVKWHVCGENETLHWLRPPQCTHPCWPNQMRCLYASVNAETACNWSKISCGCLNWLCPFSIPSSFLVFAALNKLKWLLKPSFCSCTIAIVVFCICCGKHCYFHVSRGYHNRNLNPPLSAWCH